MDIIWKGALAAAAVITLAASSLPVQAQDNACGTDRKIDIAEMTWASAAAIAHIHAHILKDGYGCNVEVVSGDTVPTSASMLSKGVPAIAPELWTSSIQEQWKKGLDDKKVVELGDTFEGGGIEGWFIPEYFHEQHPELKTADDVLAHPELFPDPEDSSKGRLYSCPPGWACELANSAMYEAYDMKAKGWNLFSPGSGGNLDASISRAFLRKEPIFFYYWGPTAILGKYASYAVELPAVDEAGYQCNTSPDCDKPPVKTAWPSSPIKIGVASWITTDAKPVADYLKGTTMTRDAVSKLVAWGDDNKADAEDTAVHFLKANEDIWTKWVSPEIAAKVKASLG
ncbi:MAG TPA: glycine betaine ABC transporter substrate-binding protein [Devosia sp.]|jgi:glycine betaine/proline transport system substrate-binding protein|nr:glycine betaine ABC transporter substrate-binding protein [Devosia sp.]